MKPRVLVAAIVAGVASYRVSADAHMPLPTVKAERTVEIRLDEEPIRIAYRISFGATLAAEERKAADRDADSAISASEGNSRLDQRTDELLAALEICTGTTLETLVCKKLGRREVERVEAEGWEPDASGHLHLSWTLALPQRAKEIGAIRVDDAWEVPGVEVSDVAILPPKHAVLELAGEAGRSSGVASHISWIEQRRQPGVRSVVAVWPAPRPSSRRKIALIVAIAALLAAGGFWASRRRSS